MPTRKKSTQEILPWNNEELEALLKEVISHGTETSKIDFKSEIETSTTEQKNELLKDITAIANSFDTDNYEDHGFIIFGVKAKTIIGITQTELDTDKFQNHIEQLLRSNISPMPQIYVMGFETSDAKKWGAIVVPPRNTKPHMFFKDISCTNPKHSRKKGEWFVRRGATTDPGLPEDLSIITQRQMEVTLEPLKESIRSLQTRIAKTEDQYNSALFKLVERAVSAIPQNAPSIKKVTEIPEVNTDISDVLGIDLPNRLKEKLRTPKDAISEDLIAEAKNLRTYLESSSNSLPWVPQLNNSEENKKIIEEMEERVKSFQISVATILLNDNTGVYTDSLLRSLKILFKMIEAPSGVQYNRIGVSIRYYPLWLIIYTIFTCAVSANRGSVLKSILEIPLKSSRDRSSAVLSDIYFFCYEARSFFNDAFNQRWCEPISQRIRQVLNDRIAEMISEFSEPEYFFKGEFVLCLANIVKGMRNGEQADGRKPLGGLYLYIHEAQDPIRDFILENPKWFGELYEYPLNEILDMFDRNAHAMAGSGCFATAMHGFKAVDSYNEALRKKK